MNNALLLSVLAMLSSVTETASQVVYEVFAKHVTEQDGGPAPRSAPPQAGPAVATRQTPIAGVLLAGLSTPSDVPAGPVSATRAMPQGAASPPDSAPAAGLSQPSKTLLAVSSDTPARLADGSVFLPSPIQLLIGLRTQITAVALLHGSAEIAGRVVTSRDVGALVQATQPGIIEAAEGGVPRIGMTVARGQLLAYLRPTLDAARAAEIRARIAELNSLIDMGDQRIGRLREVMFIRYRDSKIAAVQAEMETDRRQARILASLLTDRVEIRAVTQGIVSRVNFVQGQIVDPQTPLIEVVDPSRLWVEAAAFDPGTVQDIGLARAVTSDHQTLPLRFVGGGLTLQNQAVPLQFEIVGGAAAVQVGTPVTVLVEHAHASRQGIRVPAAALVRNSAGETIVWEKLSAEAFISRPVSASPLDGESVAVTAGLTANMRIVVAGSAMLSQVR